MTARTRVDAGAFDTSRGPVPGGPGPSPTFRTPARRQGGLGEELDAEPDQGLHVPRSGPLEDLNGPPDQCYRNVSGRAQNAGSSPSRRKIAPASAAVFRRQSGKA